MLVLVGCEESQAVCMAFRERGHEAYSCDIQECSGGHPEWHIQGDVFAAVDEIKPELFIGHPPCTYLSNAGNAYFNIEKYGDKAISRMKKREEAFLFFKKMFELPINKICLENPVGYINRFITPHQTIHPYFFGDRDFKRTCLWLKGLPRLQHFFQDDLFQKKTHTEIPLPKKVDSTGRSRHFTESIKNQKDRSKTFPSIAAAMADQWGNL